MGHAENHKKGKKRWSKFHGKMGSRQRLDLWGSVYSYPVQNMGPGYKSSMQKSTKKEKKGGQNSMEKWGLRKDWTRGVVCTATLSKTWVQAIEAACRKPQKRRKNG